MAKLQNNFVKGIIDKDNDSRLVDESSLIDAENFLVTTTEGSNRGVGKNVPGNIKKTIYNIPGAKTIGTGSNESKNKIYNFIKGTSRDYIIEYDVENDTSSIVLQSTTGTRLNFKTGERILNVDIISSGEANEDLIMWSGDSNPPRIGNIERMKTWALDGFTAEEIMLIKAPPTYSPTLNPIISTENEQANYLENKFLSFATRFRYKDGYYSAVSSWTKYFFEPNTYDIDFETFENKGMINRFNSVEVSFDTGEREVVSIDLVFKFSNETTIYKVDSFVKADEGWGDNTTQTIEFNNSKVYGILPESEYFRSFDNVPEAVVAQTTAGNRSMFANYKEGKNLIDKNGNKVVMEYTLDLVTSNIIDTPIVPIDATKDYNFDSTPISLPKGQININLTDVELKKDSALIFTFKLKSNVLDLEFISVFKFTLERDYTDLTDLITNSALQAQLDNFTTYFTNNGGVSYPVDSIPPFIILKGFEATNTGNTLSITFPVIKYEIDEDPDPNSFVRDYFYNNFTEFLFTTASVTTSLKSYRSYEICMIYRDLQCRKTTALTSAKNTLFIPNKNAITKNRINVNIPTTQKPPAWAKTYKFGLKINQGLFETIPINIFFIDGIFRWIKLDGENKNKIKDGDILIIKRDGTGFLENPIKVKVLELKEQPYNFITTNASDILEPAGLYAKIRALNFEMNYGKNEFWQQSKSGGTSDGRPKVFMGPFSEINDIGEEIDKPFPQGSTIHLKFRSDYANEDPRILYDRLFTAQQNYANFKDFFDTQIAPVGFESTSHPGQGKIYEISLDRGVPHIDYPFGIPVIAYIDTTPPNDVNGKLWLTVQGTEAGTGADNPGGIGQQYGRVYVDIDIRKVSAFFIFENTAKEIKNDVFYETPEIYDVVDGEHQMVNHLLNDTYNCFCQGNGVESYQIRDAFNEKYISIDFSPTAISEDEYKQVNRFADITYSGVFNSNTNVNRLNEFNLSLANFKDDIEKRYGPIMKIKGQDTNLEVYQEDKVSTVYYGKDLLFNADGTSNLSRIEDVLGQQNTDGGEYGISFHPDSFDDYAFNSYITDTKRGVVLKRNYNNGLFEISFQGMRNYFKKLFRDNKINHINGKYDQFHDYYLLNIQYNDTEYVTWVYSDKDNGWLGRLKFNPEDMIRINNEFISFKDGEVYLHNQKLKGDLTGNYNTFYGIESPSKFSFNFSQYSSDRKNYENLSIEGTSPLEVILKTDLDNGYIHKEDFEKKEGVYYAYLRNKNGEQDTSKLSFQGLGEPTISGLTLNFGFDLDSVVSVGDEILNQSLQLVGTVLSKTSQSIVLDTVNNIVNGDFVLASKPQSIENQSLLGYNMEVECEFSSTDPQEFFAINSETSKSFE